MGAILELVLGLLGKVAPLLLSFFAGKQTVEKKNLEATVKEGELRNEIETKNSSLSRDNVIDRLRQPPPS